VTRLHPNPAHKRDVMASSRQHCGTDVSSLPLTAAKSMIASRSLTSSPMSDASLQGGVRPRCAKKFKAAPPSGMEPGSPFGENLHALVIYLCFTQGIAFGRLARLPPYILGFEISEGAVVNMQDAARNTFARQTRYIRTRLMSGAIMQSDETGLRAGNGTGGCGCSTLTTAPSSSLSHRAAKRWSRASSACFGPISGSQTVTVARWAGRNRKTKLVPLNPIRDVQDTIDDIFAPDPRHLLGRACRIGRRRDKFADATLKNLWRPPRRAQGVPASHATGVKLQRVITKIRRHLFVFDTSRNSGHQLRLRTSVAPLRHFPQNHQWLPHRTRRASLRL
jgi:transposase